MPQKELQKKLLSLIEEHRDLDDAINILVNADTAIDQLKVQRMKKRKLNLKDQISRLKTNIVPDIIA